METRAGIKLTEEEIKLIKSAKRLAKKWRQTTDRLWLFSGSGTLHVMMYEGITNPTPEHTQFGGVNPENIIEDIDIPNDGGDW